MQRRRPARGDQVFFGADVIVALAICTPGYIALVRCRLRRLTDSDQEGLLRSIPKGMQRGAIVVSATPAAA